MAPPLTELRNRTGMGAPVTVPACAVADRTAFAELLDTVSTAPQHGGP
jgi:hypothetical protein